MYTQIKNIIYLTESNACSCQPTSGVPHLYPRHNATRWRAEELASCHCSSGPSAGTSMRLLLTLWWLLKGLLWWKARNSLESGLTGDDLLGFVLRLPTTLWTCLHWRLSMSLWARKWSMFCHATSGSTESRRKSLCVAVKTCMSKVTRTHEISPSAPFLADPTALAPSFWSDCQAWEVQGCQPYKYCSSKTCQYCFPMPVYHILPSVNIKCYPYPPSSSLGVYSSEWVSTMAGYGLW